MRAKDALKTQEELKSEAVSHCVAVEALLGVRPSG